MSHFMKSAVDGAKALVGDHVLPLLIIGVIVTAFGFKLLFDADAPIVGGIFIIGVVTALIESGHPRRHKD